MLFKRNCAKNMSNIISENITRTDQSNEKQNVTTQINSSRQQTLEYQRSHSFQEDNTNNTSTKELNNFNAAKKSETNCDINKASYCFRSPNSIESINVPSPAGSLEQFDVMSTPLSVDDTSDLYVAENTKDSNLVRPTPTNSPNVSVNSKQIDLNNPNFKFRRHSSQISINLSNLNSNFSTTTTVISPLTVNLNNSNSVGNSINSNDRVCSSPINNLKMSSRVCQIKIDEGIDLHLSREIKSERETQNTLKLKSSCDELMLNSDDICSESFSFDANTIRHDRTTNNSPNSLNISSMSNTFKRYRTFSESINNTNITSSTTTINNSNINNSNTNNQNLPSPSMISYFSYSNSCSPTGGLTNTSNLNSSSNHGLLRCYSPSSISNNTITNNLNNTSINNQAIPIQHQIHSNYFSQSPSPTRKLFLTRRSMSPLNLKQSSLSLNSNNLYSNKRKFSDIDQTDLYSSQNACSPKRANNEQEFVQPLLICTGTLNHSSQSPSSPSPKPSSLVITTKANKEQNIDQSVGNYYLSPKNIKQKIDEKSSGDNILNSDLKIQASIHPGSEILEDQKSANSSILRPTIQKANIFKKFSDDKYTFVPIQLPISCSKSDILTNNTSTSEMNDILYENVQSKLSSTLAASTNSSFYPLVKKNSNLDDHNSIKRSLDKNSYHETSISNSSNEIKTDLPDSDYNNTAQMNSDSEPCK